MAVAVVAGGSLGVEDVVRDRDALIRAPHGVVAPEDARRILDEHAGGGALAVVHALIGAHAREVVVVHGGGVRRVEDAGGSEEILTAAARDGAYTLSDGAVRAGAHEVGVSGGRGTGGVLGSVGRGVIDPVAVHGKAAVRIAVVDAEGDDHLCGVVVDGAVLVLLCAHDALLEGGAPFVAVHAADVAVDEVDILALLDIVAAVGHDVGGGVAHADAVPLVDVARRKHRRRDCEHDDEGDKRDHFVSFHKTDVSLGDVSCFSLFCVPARAVRSPRGSPSAPALSRPMRAETL